MMPRRSSCTKYLMHSGLAQPVVARHLLQRPLAQDADRAQQQLLVGHHRLFLLLRQFLQQRLRVGHATRQFGEIQLERAADRVDARQRHVALGQHALDAGLRHAQRARQVGVGHLRGLEFLLQGQDEVGGGAHESEVSKFDTGWFTLTRMYRNIRYLNRRRHSHTCAPPSIQGATMRSTSLEGGNHCCVLACLGLAGAGAVRAALAAARALSRVRGSAQCCGACRSPWTCCPTCPSRWRAWPGRWRLRRAPARAPEQRAAGDGGVVLRRPGADGGRLRAGITGSPTTPAWRSTAAAWPWHLPACSGWRRQAG